MFSQVKKQINKNFPSLLNQLDKKYSFSCLSPFMWLKIKKFLLRPGKRIRPALFVVGYKGYSPKNASGLYKSALSLEMLHAFLLIHDDIIDKSLTRRGKPSMHAMFDQHLQKNKKAKFNGSDLAIIAGDIIYALALDAFLTIKEDLSRKEKALAKLIKAAAFTGSGEFIELTSGLKSLKKIKKKEIYQIYDYKTAFYTFSYPLSIGATLAGAGKKETAKLEAYGKCLGQAFQIKDDILGLFGDEKKTGKSSLSDLQEAKKTLLIYYTYQQASQKEKRIIDSTFGKKKIGKKDLEKIKKLVLKTKGLELAQKDIKALFEKSCLILNSLKMKKKEKQNLTDYFSYLFNPQNYPVNPSK